MAVITVLECFILLNVIATVVAVVGFAAVEDATTAIGMVV